MAETNDKTAISDRIPGCIISTILSSDLLVSDMIGVAATRVEDRIFAALGRQKLCLPGMVEFRVNNADGLPYFFVVCHAKTHHTLSTFGFC